MVAPLELDPVVGVLLLKLDHHCEHDLLKKDM